ncbi:hypothetical protein [Enterococcus rivorum]|uniref:hypothetical protein n=1 Tax=Enterococcus rivorum TaxID=762845 RepID=UPI001FE22A51|nr:hypothetical protein [Enterococcus rivorum]
MNKTTSTFEVVYFQNWNDRQPLFTHDPKKAKKYWHNQSAEKDLNLLNKVKSETAKTLSIKLVS